MYAFTLLAGLLAAATTVSSSPIAENAATTFTCPNIGTNSINQPLITPADANNGRCCTTGWSYISGEGREACCRNDPALLSDPTFKYALPCSSEWWSTSQKVLLLRNCNLSDPYRCSADCDGVPWLYPTAKPCPAKN
ncbi:hypothetical protein GMOD_00000788 [Pyrenophora seminiperda CCB06]|uniref:Uncharacterized protein n=1 Tax=Pyrenophora seminiperda CCB06 TaxID=1302712 RepID=A0A3M7M844_9PLEO|nr:hypothetical protein GMOD_00000788 [Pyrenophora seminiperda CCB06]